MNVMRYDDACGAFSLADMADDLKHRFQLLVLPKEPYESYNIRPTHSSAVVRLNENGDRELENMKWGLIPSWWKEDPKISYKLFNARDDKVFTSGMWRAVYKRRALIPASGYYEWTKPPKGTPKQKFYYTNKQMDIFSFAGFYDVWKDAGGMNWKTFTIITTEPNKEASKVHNRMPVILHQDDEAGWLDPSKTKREQLEQYLHPLEDGALNVIEVSNETKSFSYNDKELIAPLNSK